MPNYLLKISYQDVRKNKYPPNMPTLNKGEWIEYEYIPEGESPELIVLETKRYSVPLKIPLKKIPRTQPRSSNSKWDSMSLNQYCDGLEKREHKDRTCETY